MSAFHFIVITSQYRIGKRVGWHYSSQGPLNKTVIKKFFQQVKEKCGSVQFGIHKLSTSDPSWKSVVEKDKFFSDVIVTEDMKTFIDYVSSDKKLTAIDVAKFILTVVPSSHLKLQKLLYYCYAEFLIKTGKKLFEEPIVSYKYGPVVEKVFHKFKIHGSSIIDYQEDETFIISPHEELATPSFIKIALSEHGTEALESIIKVLLDYGDKKPLELVEKTHRPGGPWSRVYKPGVNSIITDELITQYHFLTK